jgi:hypothetical protein
MRRPVGTEPVKNTPFTGLSTRAAPVAAVPITGTKTSSGTPAMCRRSAMASPVREANSEGLYRTALPASRAGRNTFEPTK